MGLGLGAPELVIILVIVLVVFGAGKLPEVAGSLGKGIREFRTAQQEPVTPPTPPQVQASTEAKEAKS